MIDLFPFYLLFAGTDSEHNAHNAECMPARAQNSSRSRCLVSRITLCPKAYVAPIVGENTYDKSGAIPIFGQYEAGTPRCWCASTAGAGG
jgi:hypothetical protein